MTDGARTFAHSDRTECPADKIEAALATRWRRIGEEAVEQKQPPVTRAFLWNLIVSGPVDQTPALIDQLATELPARAIVLRRPAHGDGQLRVFVETNVARKGPHTVGSDEVIIEIGGTDEHARAACARVPSIVRSALVPDALTALVWVGAPPPVDHVTREFVTDIDRLILDSRRITPEPHGEGECGLGAILAIAEHNPNLELADLAWLGISPLRGLCASFFDPPQDAAPLSVIDEVVVSSGVEGVQVRGLLMLGWLGARLGWRAPSQLRAEKPGQRRFCAVRPDGGIVSMRIETELGGPRHGVRRFELAAGQKRWSLVRDDEKIEVLAPGMPVRIQPARSHSVGERLAEALGGKGRDRQYRHALAFAAALAGAVAP